MATFEKVALAAIVTVAAVAVCACQRSAAPADQADQRVTGSGTLIREADGALRLCATVMIPDVGGPRPVGYCNPPAVRVAGVPDSVFTVRGDGGRARTETVRVAGVYRDGTVSVDTVEPGSRPPGMERARPPVPCDPPPGGWRAGSVYAGPADLERARHRLAQVVEADRDTYADHWVGHPDGHAASVTVLVVGTVGDVGQARRAVAAVYGDNVCVHRARFSAAELDRTAAELVAGGMAAEADVTVNRVRVRPAVLDAAANRLLDEVGREAVVIEPPLLDLTAPTG